ncbi:MAG: hypothetical protein ACUVRD_05475 [Bacteroidia bacterium]
MSRLLLYLSGLFLCAQTGLRYVDPVFSQIRRVENVIYGKNVPFGSGPQDSVELLMDVYLPEGDTSQARPVIILIHAGSYLPPYIATSVFGRSPLGDKQDSCMVRLAIEFARRGYVAISATHRLGWNPQGTTQEARASSIIQAVWRSVQDMRACVRYLRKTASQGNPYKIDSNHIVMGGSSSGGYTALHTAYLNLPSELDQNKFRFSNGDPFVDTTDVGMGRGNCTSAFEGGSGHCGYDSRIQAVLNLGGALGDTSFIQNEGVPVISFHGVNDNTTPYTNGVVLTAVGNYPIIEVFGSHDVNEYMTQKGNQAALINAGFNDSPYPGLYPFYGVGFQPWGWYGNSTATEKERALRYIDTIMSFSSPRLKAVLNLPSITMPIQNSFQLITSLAKAGPTLPIQLAGNPSSVAKLHLIHPNTLLSGVEVYTFTGQKIASHPAGRDETICEVPFLVPGTYLVRAYTRENQKTFLWTYLP